MVKQRLDNKKTPVNSLITPERIFFISLLLLSMTVIGGLIYKLKKIKGQLTPDNQ
jgi:hypothetical protein